MKTIHVCTPVGLEWSQILVLTLLLDLGLKMSFSILLQNPPCAWLQLKESEKKIFNPHSSGVDPRRQFNGFWCQITDCLVKYKRNCIVVSQSPDYWLPVNHWQEYKIGLREDDYPPEFKDLNGRFLWRVGRGIIGKKLSEVKTKTKPLIRKKPSPLIMIEIKLNRLCWL